MRRPFREHLKDLFALHRAEAQAFRLVTLAVLGAAGWVTYEQWFRQPAPLARAGEVEALQEWLARRDSAERVQRQPAAMVLQPFDPNDLDLAGWQAVGLTERQARSVLNYAERSGGFASKADVRKLRVVRPDLYAAWEPYLLLPDSAARKQAAQRTPPRTTDTLARQVPWNARPASTRSAPRSVELNTADTLQLIALPGIGPSLARSIVGYRERLGGYVSLDQLMEVRLLQAHPENMELFRERLVLDTLMVRRIPINACSAEELAAHPYVSWKVAKALVSYRMHHGPFAEVRDIRGCVLVTDSLVRKLAPYLSTE